MRIMGLSLLNPEFPSPAGRFLLFTTKVMNRTFPSKIYLIFFLDTANLEINPCSKKKLSGETDTDCDITDFISHIAKRNTMDFHET